jgi:hypothetical protein
MKTATLHIPLPDVSVETSETVTTKRNGVVTRKITETPHGIEYMNAGEQRKVFEASANIGQSAPAAIISFFADALSNTLLAEFKQDDKVSKAEWRNIVNDEWQRSFGNIDKPSSFGPIQNWIRYNIRYNLVTGLHSDDGMVLSAYVLKTNKDTHAKAIKLAEEKKQAELAAIAYEQQAELKKVA